MSKQIFIPPILVDLSRDSVISDFLDFQKKTTKQVYTSYFHRIKMFTTETGAQMLANHQKWERKIFSLQRWLIQKGYSENYAVTVCGAVRGFFAYNHQSLNLTHQQRKRLSASCRSTSDYYLDKEDVKKMSMHANLRDNYILLVGKSLGLRASDFVSLTYGQFRGLKLDNPSPIFIGKIGTKKKKVSAYPFLDSDAVEIVKEILDANTDKPDDEFILLTKGKKQNNYWRQMKVNNLSIVLQRLAKKAKIAHGSKRIRFHCLRKYLCDRLSSVMSESKWKMIVGKKISESAYISSNSLRNDYIRAMPSIAINDGNGNGKVKKDLENTKNSVETLAIIISGLKAENAQLRLQMASKKDTNAMSKMMFDLTERLKVLEVEEKKRQEELKKKELAELMKPEKIENYT